MKLSNTQYDIIKWVIAIVLPAFGALIGTLGAIYGWGWSENTVNTISAFTVFLGAIFMSSSKQYQKNQLEP